LCKCLEGKATAKATEKERFLSVVEMTRTGFPIKTFGNDKEKDEILNRVQDDDKDLNDY
jgi:hypothetical protein